MCNSSGEDGDGLKAITALAQEAGAAGRGAWGSELGFRTSVLLSSEAGGRWHTVPGTQLPAVLRHEQAPSLAPPFPEQQLWSHPDSKPTVGAGEGSSEGDLSLHTLRQRGFRLKSFILIEFSEWKLPNIAALCRNILALRAPASRGNFHRFEYFTSLWTDRQWGARVQKAEPAADPAMLAQLTGFSATAMLLRGSPHQKQPIVLSWHGQPLTRASQEIRKKHTTSTLFLAL